MHNEYITSCCILSKKNKLLLLKYDEVDITPISDLLLKLAINLMDQCYNQVYCFHQLNKPRKNYKKLEPLVVNQLEDMLFVKRKFIEYFSRAGNKTKKDLLTYVFGHQISDYQFNDFIYNAILRSLKDDFKPEFWDKNNLYSLEAHTLINPDMYILRDTENECSVGQANFSIDNAAQIINQHANTCNSKVYDPTSVKLGNAKAIANILDNYYSDYAMYNLPFKDRLSELVDNIVVSKEMDKPKQLIKRE